MGIQLLNEDNMAVMARYPDKYFSLAIVDPPYGISFESGGQYYKRKNKLEKKRWDKDIPEDRYFEELFRVSQSQIIWGGNYFDLPPTRCMLVWFKTDELVGRTFSEFEYAWTSFNSPARIIQLRPFQRNGSRIHPTQKPIELYSNLLDNYAQKDFRILDTHLGSGSSAIAAHQFGIAEFVGTEIDFEYFTAAKKRFDLVTSQTQLFKAS